MLVLLLILLGLIGWLGVEIISVLMIPDVSSVRWYAAVFLIVWFVGGIARGFYDVVKSIKDDREQYGHTTVSNIVDNACIALVVGSMIGLPILIYEIHCKIMKATLFVKKKTEP